ncbi:MAG: hypothetical protein H8E14_04755 [Candidatus Marinimicrobia bacterium]|nr:hypothetical protein [Candidatus Neomarinimicrobiota bacterium]
MANRFAHIYIEEQARDYTLTANILKNFPNSIQVGIDNYQEVFHRANQQFVIQKNHLNLILAVKKDGLLYAGSPECQDYANPNFFYTTPVLNCIYDCSYCFLQGKYSSANIVVFVNQDDFFTAVRQELPKRPDLKKPLFLALSYDTDLMATENLIPISRDWIEFACSEYDLLVEIRTKSSAFSMLADVQVTDQVLLAWTLSPQEVIDQYERLTPSLEQRLTAVNKALAAGWHVRICIDPIVYLDNWMEIYAAFVDKIFMILPPDKIYDINVGTFRMNATFYRRIKNLRPDSDPYFRLSAKKGKIITMPEDLRQRMLAMVRKRLSKYLPKSQIVVWE